MSTPVCFQSKIRSSLVLMVALGIAYGEQLPAQAGKQPIPSDADQERAMTLAHDVYGKEYTAAKTGEQKQKLVDKLLQKAAESKADPPSHFVLLKLARDVAAVAGEVDLAFKAIDETAETFDVKPVTLKYEAFTKAAQAVRSQKQNEMLAWAAVSLMDDAASVGEFEIAVDVGKKGLVAAKASQQKEVVAQLLVMTEEAEENASAYGKAKEAIAALKDRPTDAALNLVVGKYLCFFKSDWDRGVPMLALGNDESLSALGKLELQGAKSPDEQMKLGDAWWDLAEKETGTVKKQLRGRAGYWYSKAVVSLSGLPRDRVQKRLELIPQPKQHVDAQVRRSIEAGLSWLEKQQSRDGSWTFATRTDPGTYNSVVAATSLATTPFLRAGSTHFSGKYRAVVSKAIKYLLSRMKKQGDLRDGDSMYVQGVATIALCEAYSLTKDRKLRGPCQSAVDFIVSAQHPTTGGWRYTPGQDGDTSVSAWEVTALKIAESTGLRVPRHTFDGAQRWLDLVQEDNGAQYKYLPAPDHAFGTPSMSAAGLVCRSYLGWTRETPAMKRGVSRVVSFGDRLKPLDSIYFNYYATRLMERYGGEEWHEWQKTMHARLMDSQSKDGVTAGSWFSGKDTTISKHCGRVGMTSFYLMTMEVGLE